MTVFCRSVPCEAKIKRETGAGFELVFVPYQTEACVSANSEEEAAALLNAGARQDACEAVKEVEGSPATFQRAVTYDYCQDVTYKGKQVTDHGDGERYEFVEQTEQVCVRAFDYEDAKAKLQKVVDGFCASKTGPRFAICSVLKTSPIKLQNPNY